MTMNCYAVVAPYIAMEKNMVNVFLKWGNAVREQQIEFQLF